MPRSTVACPTLVFAGEFDPITPPALGKAAATTLSNSTLLVFREYTHGVFGPGCPMEVAAAVLAAPTEAVDRTCVEQLPGVRFIAAPQ